MDAKTGFLLALVDRPAVDPNKMSGRITRAELAAIHADPLQPELFRAIQQHYHPGSHLQGGHRHRRAGGGGAAARRHGLLPGPLHHGWARWRCDKESGHGQVDLEHALGASCDVFFYALGDRWAPT